MLRVIAGIIILMFCAVSLVGALIYAAGVKTTIFVLLASVIFALLIDVGLTLLLG